VFHIALLVALFASTARDPQRLADYINTQRRVDFELLRKALGIHDDGIFLPPCDDGDCHAEVIPVPGAKPEQTILWASHTTSNFAFWLRYGKNASGAWRFLGASAVNVKYFEPEHKLTTVFGRPFFIVVEQGIAGTGVSSRRESWFDLTLPRTDPVLAFTRQGDETIWPSPVDHEVEATASPSKRAGNEEIKLDLSARFQSGSLNTELCHATATAWYVRRKNGEFKLDPVLSTVPESILKFVFDIQDDPPRPDAETLRSFLQTCKDMPDKSELLRLLH
jgi:hypothetical protein